MLRFISIATVLVSCTTEDSPADDTETGPGVKPLTCEVIASQNCWKEAVAAVAECAPGASITGTLSDHGKTCSYSSGDHLVIDSNPDSDFSELSFTLTHDGSLCADYARTHEPENVQTLQTKLGTVSWTYTETIRLSCPDGSVYETGSLDALRCEGFASSVGTISRVSEDDFYFSLMAKPESVDVASCVRQL